MSVINPELRAKTEASLKPEQKPSTIFKYYLVFKYSFANYSVLGYDDKEVALALEKDYLAKGALDINIVEGYPYEVMVEWKKKDKNG